jgi:hypothetical protein
VSIPSSVTSIGARAFACDTLLSFEVDAANKHYKSVDGILFSKDGTALCAYPVGKDTVSYSIPSSVTSIGVSAFENNHLTSVTIPSSVTSIGNRAFAYGKLTSVSIGANVSMDENERFSSVDHNFDYFYEKNGKKAGIYKWNGSSWSYSAR